MSAAPPAAYDGVVYVSRHGEVVAVSEADSRTAGSKMVDVIGFNGMAIGGGLLVVPAGNQLTAFGN